MLGYPRRRNPAFFFIVYLVFGAYFINYPFQFIKIPASFAVFDKWIILVGGILVILGAINHYKVSTRFPF